MSALPLRARLGTPDECLVAARARARALVSLGELRLAETLLRGVVALDPRTPGAAAELAAVLLARALEGPRELVVQADAWARWALELDPDDTLARDVATRLSRIAPR